MIKRLRDVKFLYRFWNGTMGVVQVLLGLYFLRRVPPERLVLYPDWIQFLVTSPIYAMIFVIAGLVLIFQFVKVQAALLLLFPTLSIYLVQLYASIALPNLSRKNPGEIILGIILISLVYLVFRTQE